MTKALYAKVAGAWKQVYPTLPPVPKYNEASGGTVSEYEKDGKWWRVHKWTASDPVGLDITVSVAPFRILVVAGGGGSGSGQSQGGQGGRWGVSDAFTPPVGQYAVVVGAGGAAGAAGGRSDFGPVGGPNSAGALGGAAVGNVGRDGDPGVQSDITGTMLGYGGGGGKGGYTAGDPSYSQRAGVGVDGGGNACHWNGGCAQPGVDGRGGGGGGGGQDDGGVSPGARGGSGFVAVAYEIEPPQYNAATGGTVADVTNYNGTGETWRVHTFTAGANFVVSNAPKPFKVLSVAGGGAGYTNNIDTSGGGGGGEVIKDDAADIPVGTHAVVVGDMGRWNGSTGNQPTASSIGGAHVARPGTNCSVSGGGGGSGNGNAPGGGKIGGGGGAGGAASGQTGGPGVASDATGTSVTYGVGGSNTSSPGTPGSGGTALANNGFAGLVVIAYKIA